MAYKQTAYYLNRQLSITGGDFKATVQGRDLSTEQQQPEYMRFKCSEIHLRIFSLVLIGLILVKIE